MSVLSFTKAENSMADRFCLGGRGKRWGMVKEGEHGADTVCTCKWKNEDS
jgi:hypothetical protein